ncbi:DUF4294 domain-containing protein [Halosquirtibacter laminarini]|uniref:DUF4294 domain-containing protein n=1 Tax=Halosquirtibacter laminarini TaxID=3374600 RepID=A0AC61NMT7_9BACT|nr:DUF4294 domain-containing protein [Prolixibacteraceae bacterium]
MNKRIIFFFIVLPFLVFVANTSVIAQEKKDNSIEISYTDSIMHVDLSEITIIPPYRFKNGRQKKRYEKLENRLRRVYPVSLIVLKEYEKVNKEYDEVYHSKKKRKEYIKWYQKHVYETYIDTVKALSYSENKLLLKLISYQTGKSPYALIKDFRGTANAWLWRGMAFMAGANLNTSIDEEDDKMLLHIIKRIEADQF